MKRKIPNRQLLSIMDGYENDFLATQQERLMAKGNNWWGIGGPVVKDGVASFGVECTLYASDYQWLQARLEQLALNDDVQKVVFNFDSPGGDVSGLFECAEYIANFPKPTYAYVTGSACSAAYLVASACDEIVASPYSRIGCCGVMVMAYDDSSWLEKMGIKVKAFRSKNADKKCLDPFSDAGAAEIQKAVDSAESDYYSLIAQGRGMDKQKCIDAFGHGLVFDSGEALANGMIDRTASYDEFFSSLEAESEGEEMDISKLTAEEQAAMLASLLEANPSLLATQGVDERVRAERERIFKLNAMSNVRTKDLVEKAISDGTSLEAIYEQINAINAKYIAELEEKVAAFQPVIDQANATQTIDVPVSVINEKAAEQARIDTDAEIVNKARG